MYFSSDKLYNQSSSFNSHSTDCNADATYLYHTNRNDYDHVTCTGSRDYLFN